MRLVNKIILHNSASSIKAHDDISVIDEWHKARGFKCKLEDGTVIHTGYHYFIKSDGEVQTGRPLERMGAHCKGHNSKSIGICLHGKDSFTVEQFESCGKLVKELLEKFPEATIHGHNEFADKACPVFDVDDFVEDYISNIDSITIKA